ncbi:hypothetical protein B0T26DRAFT_758143 [Lasiosphaeria miniovina]|uniref:Uncharacterized protein n=1 Tax=Lasiosphaeria miniovina TaxID=1954250 RepID=A0AA40ED04_9PEZI|nr:uncharacterized protein B0T26DRAFT_758143 [Lasiosphaeria miniovina]KAK0732906.1 hypothetical protein B0T26DRAFT_758143 [Lasiosphaeria miniovina]
MLALRIIRSQAGASGIPALLAAQRAAVPLRPGRVANSQARRVGTVLGRDPKDDMGGPGGQEIYPASWGIQKHYRIVTALGVATACAVMTFAKLLEWNKDPDSVYVLLHDSTKGELGDVLNLRVKRPEMANLK